MKRNLYTTLTACLMIWLCLSCADDQGNYDYIDLNDIGISFDESYEAIARERFSITPQITNGTFKAEAYTYEWKAYDRNNGQEPVVLGTDLNLDITLHLLQGNYLLVLNVKERSSGLYYQRTASLQVNTPTSLGWLVLCSDNGQARLDMVSHIKNPHSIYRNLLEGSEPGNWHNPNQLICDSKMEEPFYLVTEDGCTRLSNKEFVWDNSYMIANEFGTGIFTGTAQYMASHFPGKLLIDDKGRVYYCNTLMGDGLFGTVRSNRFYVAPAAGYNAKNTQIVPSFMMWDKTNRQFVVCAQEFYTIGLDNLSDLPMSEMASLGFPVLNEDAFAWPKRADRMDFICMGNTLYDRNQDGNGMTYAILGKNDQRFLYGIILGDLYAFANAKYGYSYEKAYYVDLSACTDIQQASGFAFSSLKTFLYYSVGNKLYRVNFADDTPTARLEITLPEDEEISLLKFYLWEQDDPAHHSYDLIVGSKNQTTGESTLRIYDGFSNEGIFTDAVPTEEYEGFADIVDVIYRENIIYQP